MTTSKQARRGQAHLSSRQVRVLGEEALCLFPETLAACSSTSRCINQRITVHALPVNDNQLPQLSLATSNLQVYSPELQTCSLYPVLGLRFHRIIHPQAGTTRITLRPIIPDQEPNLLPPISLSQLKKLPRAPFARSPSPLMSGKAATLRTSTIRKTRPMSSTSTLIMRREMLLTADSNKIREEKRHSCLEIIRERLRGARCEKGRQFLGGWD